MAVKIAAFIGLHKSLNVWHTNNEPAWIWSDGLDLNCSIAKETQSIVSKSCLYISF
jgi:hypothetical protein